MRRILATCPLLLLACAATAPTPSASTTVSVEPPPEPTAGMAAASAPGDFGPVAPDLAERIGRFPEQPIGADTSRLDARARGMLRRVIEAAELLDQIYLRQVDPQNPALEKRLAAAAASDPRWRDALTYFHMMHGPWDRTDPHERPFLGTRARPPQADYYPPDLDKGALEAWLGAHSADKEAFQSYFTVIRRQGSGLFAVPYSKAYADLLAPAAQKLREAAGMADDPRVRAFLEKRAAAFGSNDYLESDVAWMDLGDAPYEITIGPYETYDDELMGWKASYEAYIGLRDAAESAKLAKVNQHLAELDRNLPLDARAREKTHRGNASPISVVELLYSAGQDAVHATAYNLPNDERVRKAKGSKKVLLKNIGEAKFRTSTLPIAERVMAKAELPLVTFEAYFTDVLMHEMCHGLGPATVKTPGGEEEVSKALQELYGPVEEAKADICGLVSSQWLIDKGAFPRSLEKPIYAAYLAGVFRTVRFGATEAHARGELASYGFLAEKGGLTYDAKTQRFAVDFGRIKSATRALAREWLAIESTGDRARAQKFLEKYGVMKPEMEAAVRGLAGIPVDVRPRFTVLDTLRTW